jgi:hypothetical protein
MVGHRIMGSSLLAAGNIVQARTNYDQAIALMILLSIVRWRRDLAQTVAW